MLIKPTHFEHLYRQLLYVTHQERPDVESPSFTNGLWDSQEGYKRGVHKRALVALSVSTWAEHSFDSKYIADCANEAMKCNGNLLSDDAYFKAADRILSHAEICAPILVSLFVDRDKDEYCFNAMAKQFSSIYDGFSVAAYFFFLKDNEEYAPVRRDADKNRLHQLGVNGACMMKCNWANYMVYMTVIKELKELLAQHIPETTLLDAQSFLWMLYKLNPETPEYYEQTKPRILFCNIAFMECYDLICFPWDKPKHGGSYISETGSAFESWNFHRYEDGYYYGFVETKYRGQTGIQENANQLHIENIDPSATGDSIDDVTVVFCAYSEENGNTTIVGWYTGATVYRGRLKAMDGHVYNIKAPSAMLLPPILRNEAIPRANRGGVGFGQSNVWYAKDDKATSLVELVLHYIGQYNSEEDVRAAELEAIQSLPDDALDAKIALLPDQPAPVYIAETTMRKRNPLLPEKAKRRADGLCQLCGQPAPFHDQKGRPYLEAHHIQPLAEDGPDTLRNMVALCPNCHRKMHVVRNPEDCRILEAAAKNC